MSLLSIAVLLLTASLSATQGCIVCTTLAAGCWTLAAFLQLALVVLMTRAVVLRRCEIRGSNHFYRWWRDATGVHVLFAAAAGCVLAPSLTSFWPLVRDALGAARAGGESGLCK